MGIQEYGEFIAEVLIFLTSIYQSVVWLGPIWLQSFLMILHSISFKHKNMYYLHMFDCSDYVLYRFSVYIQGLHFPVLHTGKHFSIFVIASSCGNVLPLK